MSLLSGSSGTLYFSGNPSSQTALYIGRGGKLPEIALCRLKNLQNSIIYPDMTEIKFRKMHGLGNDFVIIDQRGGAPLLTEAEAAAIGDRRRGVGCDQFVEIADPATDGTAAFLHMRNGNGEPVEACGNATRCIGRLLAEESGQNDLTVETVAGQLHCTYSPTDAWVSVNMGQPRLEASQIPLSDPDQDTLSLPITFEVPGLPALTNPSAVNMGNPHMVFFVDDCEAYPLADFGAELEHHPLYPERCNVSLATVGDDSTIRLRVFERGVGITQACGTAACATLVAAVGRGLLESPTATIQLDGGALSITLDSNNHVLMGGPASYAFEGTLNLDELMGR